MEPKDIMMVLKAEREKLPRVAEIIFHSEGLGESVQYSICVAYKIKRDELEALARKKLNLGEEWRYSRHHSYLLPRR